MITGTITLLKKKEELHNSNMDSLKEIKAYAGNVAGQWNGDESGIQEDNASIAEEVLEAVKNLEELLNQFI